MAKSNAQSALEKLNKKYGIKGNTPPNKNNNRKQSTSASSKSSTSKSISSTAKEDSKVALEKLNKKYNISGADYGATTNSSKKVKTKKEVSGLEIAGNVAMSGLGTFNKGLFSTLDFILPTEFLGKYDFVSKLNDYYSKQDEYWKKKKAESVEGKSGVTKILADVGEGTVAAIPNAVLALMSGGASAAGTTLGTSTTSGTGIASALSNTAKTWVKSPMYWTSMAQTLGTDYEEAKENGANEFVASASAIIKSAINAGVEIGGGLEKLPSTVKSGNTKLITEWVKSLVEEGGEEVVQSIVSNSVDKLMYDYNKDVVSFKDENAIINPQRMAKEFGMGAAVGGVLGGAQIGAVSGANAILNRRYKNMVDTNVPTEKQTTNPDPLEQAAREVVEERNRSYTETAEASKSGRIDADTLDILTHHNVEITPEQAKKVTGFDSRGAELVTKLANAEGATFNRVVAEVKPSYLAGFNNPDLDIKKVAHTFNSQAQADAYTLGQMDGKMEALATQERAKNARVYDGVFTENEYTKSWSEATKKMVSTVAKSFGMDVSVVDKIIASRTVENEVEIEHEANASHFDGKMEISNNKTAEKLIHALVMHEGGHRMEQFATDEWNELCSFLYERAERLGRRVELGVSQGMLFDDVKAQHDEAGISKSTREYIGEIAVRELETIFSSAEEFNSFIAEIESNQQVKSAWDKFVQWLSEIIEDLKRVWSQRKLTTEEKAEVKKALDELEHIKELYAKAYLATKDTVQTMAKEQSGDTNSIKSLENKTNEDYNGNISHSLKDSAEDGTFDVTDDVLDKSGYIGYVPIKKVKMKTFPPYKESKSDANEWATRWAHREDVESGAQTLVFYHNRCYVIGKYDSADLKYQIDGRISYNAYESIRRELEEDARNRENQSKKKMVDFLRERNERRDTDEGRGQSLDYSSVKHGREDRELLQLGGEQDGEREVQSDVGRSDERDGKDRKAKGLNSSKDFSLKGTNNINPKDHKELLDIIEHLKGEFEITKFAKADPKKLGKMTRDLLKEYDSKADYEETFKSIDGLYQYMANGEEGHPPVWEDVYNRAYNVAEEIVKSALVVDDYTYQEYKNLRNYLRTTPMKFNAEHDSVPSSYGSFNEFRKMNIGSLKFTKDGMSIDSVYQELAGMYPEFFDADEQINSAEQLERIIDVLDEIRPTEVNPFKGEIEQVSMYLASDLASRFFDIPQAKPTFADKAEHRVTEAHIKGAKKLEAVRQQKDAKIKKLIESHKEKTKKQLDKIRKQRDTKVKKEREKRREAISKMSEHQKAKVLRARIMRHTSDLSKKLVSPTDNQHIPHELQGAVAKLLECINLESNYTKDISSNTYKKNDEGLPTRRTKAFQELQKVYADISSSVVIDPDLLGEHGLLSGVMALADKRIADMNSDELDTVWQAIRAIEASVSTANKVFSEGKFATVLEIAESLRVDNVGKKEKTEFKGVIGGVKTLATLNMLTPETYLHYLGDTGDSIFRMMRNSQDKHISIMKEVSDFTHKELKDVDVNSLEKTIHTVKLGGEDIQLSTAQIMELYVLMKREQAREHILVGGILPDVTESKGSKLITKTKPIRNITVSDISAAISKLTDEQKKIADKLQRYVSTVLSAHGNEASMKVYNYEKFLEKNYWTIRTNKQEITSDIDKDTAVTSVANKGMTKATKPHANTSVRIGSIFDTFASHSSEMATYAAWLGTTEDINRIRNFVFSEVKGKGKEKIKIRTGTVKEILDTVHGTQGSKYLEKLLTDIAIGVKGIDNMNPFDKAIGNYKAASVGGNLRVIIQQPTAILRALDMIDAQYLAKGVVSPLKAWEKAKKYAPIAQWKDWGHFDINTGRQMKDVLFDDATKLEKIKQVGMWGASKADSISWGLLWNAVEAETKAKHKGLDEGTAAYYETVAKRFTEIVDHTQVVDGILQRSQVMRNPDSLSKMATSFMGEPTKQYNMAVMAANDAKNQKGDARKKAVARLGRTAMSLALSGIVNACAQSFVDAMRDDDKEKKYWEKWLAALKGDEDDAWFQKLGNIGDTFNPLNYVPFVKDVVSILSGYDVKRMDMETITKTLNAVNNMYKAVTDTGKYTIKEASAQLFAEIARMYGLPVANVKKDIKSLVMTMAIESDNYLMQYRIEKAMLDINYEGNRKNFIDILFNAYNNDREAYEFIYNDMLSSGYDADKIQSGMETRMKKAEGVEKSSELTKRYMTPDDEKKYDSSLRKIQASHPWQSATTTQRKEAEADLYDFLTSTSEAMEKMRVEALEHGVDETDYTLWQLAIEMADQPKGQKGSGSYDYKEKAEAINSLDLEDREIAYFFGKGLNESSKEELNETLNAGIDIQEYVNFKAATSEMKSDKNAKGNSIPNSKKRKIVNYLNNAGLTREEWEYFYYEIMNYKK